MPRGLNKVMLIGRLGRDPELRFTASGQALAMFPVITTRQWTTSSGERRRESESFRVVAWGSLAHICKQLLSKGKWVYVEGRLKTRRLEDENGNWRHVVEIVANELIVLDRHVAQPSNGEGFGQGDDASEAEISDDHEADWEVANDSELFDEI